MRAPAYRISRRAKQSTSQNVNWQRNVAKLEYRVLTRKAKVGEEESVGGGLSVELVVPAVSLLER